MLESLEERLVEKNPAGNGILEMSAVVYYISYATFLHFGTSIASLDPGIVELPAICHVY